MIKQSNNKIPFLCRQESRSIFGKWIPDIRFATSGKIKGWIVMALLCLHVVLNAQKLQNPSFEGSYGVAQTPQGWTAFGQASSPDTQPGAWNVTTPASHGNRYISMVCRGFSIYDSYLWESCIQNLNSPLVVGQTYHYSIDLAFSATFKADTILFDRPAQLRIWGRSANMNKELLWESGAITNKKWKTVVIAVPKIASDFKDAINGYDFQMGGIFLENYVHNEKFKIKAG